MPFNLKLHHRSILPCNLQINMIVIFSLHSFLGLLVSHSESAGSAPLQAPQSKWGDGKMKKRPQRPRQKDWGRGRMNAHAMPRGRALACESAHALLSPPPEAASPLGFGLRERAAPLHNSEENGGTRIKHECVRAPRGIVRAPVQRARTLLGAGSFALAREEGIVFSKWPPGL